MRRVLYNEPASASKLAVMLVAKWAMDWALALVEKSDGMSVTELASKSAGKLAEMSAMDWALASAGK